MCGHDWCSVRISKEIKEFSSGKDEAYAWDKPKISEALSDEQKKILEVRGELSPEEIHRLASKKSKNKKNKMSCHSDNSNKEEAQKIQSRKLIDLNTMPAHNIQTQDSIL